MIRLSLALMAAAAALCGQPQASSRPAEIPRPEQLKFPPLPGIRIPTVETYSLPSGIKVYLLEDHELPLVSGFALIRTGNLFDPPEKVGLATITGHVLRSGGTASRTGDELDVQLENIAASVESAIGESSGEVSFSALRENTDEVLEVFREVLTAPAFREDKIGLIKSQLASQIARRNDEASEIASREFTSVVYGKGTPYGWQIEYATLNRIGRQDVVDFYRRYYFPANIRLAIYGDFSIPDMKARLQKLFGGWTYQQPAVPPFPPVQRQARPGVFVATKTDVDQTFFHFGHLGGVMRDKNFPALQVMADILGGGFSSRLFKKIRTDLGYAYGIGAVWGAGYNEPGIFEISGSTKAATTTDAIQVARQEVEKLRSAPVGAQELKTAKDTVLNAFIFNFDRPARTLSRLVRYDYFGYPADFIFQYQKGIAAVIPQDVLRVAKQYVRPPDFTVVAVGNPAEFGKPLSELGLPVHPIDLTIPGAESQAPPSGSGGEEKGQRPRQEP
jgi:zinc protease